LTTAIGDRRLHEAAHVVVAHLLGGRLEGASLAGSEGATWSCSIEAEFRFNLATETVSQRGGIVTRRPKAAATLQAEAIHRARRLQAIVSVAGSVAEAIAAGQPITRGVVLPDHDAGTVQRCAVLTARRVHDAEPFVAKALARAYAELSRPVVWRAVLAVATALREHGELDADVLLTIITCAQRDQPLSARGAVREAEQIVRSAYARQR
jgi:hypothetical protein